MKPRRARLAPGASSQPDLIPSLSSSSPAACRCTPTSWWRRESTSWRRLTSQAWRRTAFRNSYSSRFRSSWAAGPALRSVLSRWYELLQLQRIPDSERLLVVVEIHIDMLEPASPGFDTRRPGAQRFRRVAALVFSKRAVQADIGKVRRNLARRLKAGQVVDGERGVVSAQYRVDFNGVEMLNIMSQHFAGRKRGIVEGAAPMFIVPAGGADANFTIHQASSCKRTAYLEPHRCADIIVGQVSKPAADWQATPAGICWNPHSSSGGYQPPRRISS